MDMMYGLDYFDYNFIDAAFSKSEQEAIKITTVVNEDNKYYGTEGGKDTEDLVYLLSLSEGLKEKANATGNAAITIAWF